MKKYPLRMKGDPLSQVFGLQIDMSAFGKMSTVLSPFPFSMALNL